MKTVITSSDKSFINFGELKRYGSLFRYLSLRDVFVRYKQTRMGFAWSIVRPVVNILIFGALRFLVEKSNSFIDSFILVSTGIVFWQLLSTTITDVSNSLSANSNILTKVYFPKLLLPLSGILVCLVDFLIAFVIFFVLFLIFKGMPPWQIVFLPLVIIYGLVFCFSLGLISATASVKYRDIKFILPFLIQILFYASPVFLSSDFVLGLNMPEWFKVIYQANPLVFILNAFKYCFTGTFESFNMVYAASSVVFTLVMLFISIKYFFNFEKSFADYI
ncbi:MAG: phosphate transporter permease [Bacteroidetes bacterium]|jgi:lipopolysaccharide transport system permease protein|nr:phosphate transporter permease [Bacteroidota bacterium]